MLGSPLKALQIDPPFQKFFFIDIDEDKIDTLREAVGDRQDVEIHAGDANVVLLNKVFPHVSYKQYWRALCLLDPYGLHLNWEVVQTAGQMGTIDILLNFPVMDMNRNVLWHNPDKVAAEDIERMTSFWGDESWRDVAYKADGMLFEDMVQKQNNQTIADAFCRRLRDVGGYEHVSTPLPMQNSSGATVYYLMLASAKSVAVKIMNKIFNKYKDRK